jgi:hypothetical protein
MAKIIQLKRALTLDEMVTEIHKKFGSAIDADIKAHHHRLDAGRMLLELRQRIEKGEAGKDVVWWPWYESKFVRSRRDAERVMAMAGAEDPEAAWEEEKAKKRATPGRGKYSQPEPESGDIVDYVYQLVVEKMTVAQQRRLIAKLKEILRRW